jgi:hypothetical protein
MPIRSSFGLAGDARREAGGTSSNSRIVSPRPVSPSKVHPFSRFHFPLSNASLPVAHSSRISSACSSTYSSFVDPDSCSSDKSSFSVLVPDKQVDTRSSGSPSNITASPNCLFTNSYHIRFNSNLSRPPPSTPLPRISSRAPILPFSKFRPSVSAPDRLRAWTSPFALRNRRRLERDLPQPLVDTAFRIVHDAFAMSTRSTYAAGILRLHQFCDSWGISEEARMPASATLLASFVGHCSGSYAGNTIRSWLSGIRAWHIIHQAPWHGDHDWVQKGRTAAFKEGTCFKAPRRAPVSLDHLRAIHQKLDLNDPLHAAIWAMATITFFGCRRLGETTVKSLSSFNPLLHATRAAPMTFHSLPDGSSSASIRIPWTKTTKQEGATIILTSRSDIFCPVAALRTHLQVNGVAPYSISLFGYRTPDGTWSHMFRDTFLSFVGRIWFSLSLDHVSGHSWLSCSIGGGWRRSFP